MWLIGLILGITAYSVLILGLLGLLTKLNLMILGIIFCLSMVYLLARSIKKVKLKSFKWWSIEGGCLILGLAFVVVNLVGALGPELFYDALWYHLTLPKLYLIKQQVYSLPGNLLYYSYMPRLTEMLYTLAMGIYSEIGAKLIHLSFGLLTAVSIYGWGKKFVGKKAAAIAGLIFYADLTVGWLSTTAYIDLARTFFETLALFCLLEWQQDRKRAWLIKSGIMIGLAVSTKLFSLGSLGILTVLILIKSKQKIKDLWAFLSVGLLTSGYWLINAWFQTGNLFYPIFSDNLSSWHNVVLYKPINFILDLFRLSNQPSDWITPISPLYLCLLPLVYFSLKKLPKLRLLGWYVLLGYLVWFITPRTGGSRFILPYLPALALLVSAVFSITDKKLEVYKKVALVAVFSVTLVHLSIRAYINQKNLKVIWGSQSKIEFLNQNLDLTHAFLDSDGWLKTHLNSNDLVYIIGGQNLFYVDFPFTHESFNESVRYNYVLTQYQELPEEMVPSWTKVYFNPLTQVSLYQAESNGSGN